MKYLVSPLETLYEPRGLRVDGILKFVLMDFDTTIITSNFDHSSKKSISKSKIIAGNRLHTTVVLKSSSYTKNLSLFRVLNQVIFGVKLLVYGLYKFKKDDQIIVMNSYPELAYVVSVLNRLKGCDFVVDLWDIWPDAFPIGNKPVLGRLFGAYCNYLNGRSLRAASRIFYVAPSFKEWTYKYSVQPEKLVYVPLGFDADRWGNLGNMGLGRKFDFCYIGYLSFQFDLTETIKACIKAGRSMAIIGDGPKFDVYRELIASYSNISMLGHLNKNDAAQILSESHVGVLPLSSGSGAQMPNKLFDYLGAGVPIIVAGGEDAGEFVVTRNIGWHCANESDAIFDVMSKIGSDEYHRFSVNLSIMRDQFSVKSIYNQMRKYL